MWRYSLAIWLKGHIAACKTTFLDINKMELWLGLLCVSQGQGVAEIAREEWTVEYNGYKWSDSWLRVTSVQRRDNCVNANRTAASQSLVFFPVTPLGTCWCSACVLEGRVDSQVHLVYKDIKNLGLSATASSDATGVLTSPGSNSQKARDRRAQVQGTANTQLWNTLLVRVWIWTPGRAFQRDRD